MNNPGGVLRGRAAGEGGGKGLARGGKTSPRKDQPRLWVWETTIAWVARLRMTLTRS